jgi:hypothetical protein
VGNVGHLTDAACRWHFSLELSALGAGRSGLALDYSIGARLPAGDDIATLVAAFDSALT